MNRRSLFFTVSPDQNPVYTYHLQIGEFQLSEGRLIGSLGAQAYYACYREVSEVQAEIQLSVRKIRDLQFDTVFTSLFILERQMIKR